MKTEIHLKYDHLSLVPSDNHINILSKLSQVFQLQTQNEIDLSKRKIYCN